MFTVYCLNIKLVLEKGPVAKTKLSSRARKLKRRQKSCLLFVYSAGPGSLKERQKVVNCLLFWHDREV